VASRSRLEEWREIGGKLSGVTQEAVYAAMDRKYLSQGRGALTALCALWQYEIPAHNLFVEQVLSDSEVKRLEKENLLDRSMVPGYGVLYEPVFHPEEAREIFEASIYRRWGYVDAKHVRAETISSLKAYLEASPPNYVSVYNRLYDQGQRAIMRKLLSDRDLQDCAASLFAVSRISDTASYLYRLSEVDRSRAQVFLDAFVQALGIDGICSRMLEHTLGDIRISLRCIQKVNTELVQEIVAKIDMEQMAQGVETPSRSDLFWLFDTLKDISPEQAKTLLESVPVQTLAATVKSFQSAKSLLDALRKREYPSVQLKELVESINMEQLARRTETESLQRLHWLIRALKDISPQQAKKLLENIPVQTLVAKASESDIGSVEGILVSLQELGYPTTQLEAFVKSIDMEQLTQRAETQSLQRLYWLIRALKDISPEIANGLLETITPAGLAALCRSKGATAKALQHFCEIPTEDFRRRFLRQFSARDIAAIFERSPLGQVGSLLQYRFRYFEDSYTLFSKRSLEQKLATELLEEIGKFIQH
jgi:hypothetical protein